MKPLVNLRAFMAPMNLDIRFALRHLRKSPGFTVTVVITLMLGIGANTAIFSVMHAVLLRRLPVREPEQLFYLAHRGYTGAANVNSDDSFGISFYNRIREGNSVLSDVVTYAPLAIGKTAVRIGDVPEEAEADEVSGNFFSAIGVTMAAGRAFSPADEDKHSPLAVLSYGYWRVRFNRDPGVIGKTIHIRGVPFTIIGVTAPHFYGVESGGLATDVWVPLQNRRELPPLGMSDFTERSIYDNSGHWILTMLVRLKPGISPQGAAAHLNPIYAHAGHETAQFDPNMNTPPPELRLVPARGVGTAYEAYEQPLRVLTGMVALVLIIACVNIVMLLVARNSVREREFALRLALGAGRWHLFRLLLAESLLFVVTGSLLGWVLALAVTRLLAFWAEFEVSLAPDASVLAFTLAISSLAAILFGLAPLRIAAGVPVGPVLKSTSDSQTTSGRSRTIFGRVLVTMEIAFCVVLLFGTGLLLRTLVNYQDTELGMRADRVLAFAVRPLGGPAFEAKLAFYRQLIARLKTIPGVKSVTMAQNRPGMGGSDNIPLNIDGRAYPNENGKNLLRFNYVAEDFFTTLGIPVLAGREIRDSDSHNSARVAVVNQTLADRYLSGANPIGHHLVGWFGAYAGTLVVGLVRDSKYESTDEGKIPMAWFSYQQGDSIDDMDIEVRTAGDPLDRLPEIQRAVREIDPNIPLSNPQVLSSTFEESYHMNALYARLAVFFGCLAALLVAVGLNGMLAYRVHRRTPEIGIRIALGATRVQVLWMILRDSLCLVAIGLAIGLPLAWFTSRLMATMLYQLSPHDPLSFALSALGVLIVSVGAALIPARRAAAVEPMRTLRME